ncbi:MAG: hypothetical protein R2828_04590 [Saprospiraceae bacterium]
MRYTISSTILAICLLAFACDSDTPSNQQSNKVPDSETTTSDTASSNAIDPSGTARTQHNCELKDKVLEGNQTWLNDQELLIAIVADETTADPDFGDGHRVLLVIDTKTCEQIQREVLPVSGSPDFPYYIAEIVYNNTSQLVGIRGADVIYCYDVKKRQLLAPLKPQFLTERITDDAQSGMIQRLEVWENYLIGYAQDMGTFVFDVSNEEAPKPLLPYAEFKTQNGDFNSLFMVPSADDRLQGIIPQYDYDADEFKINPLFSQSKNINTNLPKSAKNNRFLVLREKGNNEAAVGIDMQECKEVNLPVDVASQKTQEILQWLRSNT